MKFELIATLALSLLIGNQAFATGEVEPAGAPAIRLVRAAIPAFAKAPELTKQILLQFEDKVTDAQVKEAVTLHTNEMNGMLDEVKDARANPAHDYDTTVKSSFRDGSFGIVIETSNVRDIETTSKKVVCKALKTVGTKTGYECELEFSWGGEFESVMQYKLQFSRDSKTGVIVPRKLSRIMAG